jgi:hypothetical protein
LWTRGENLTQTHHKQCPEAGKEILCSKSIASSNPEEGILLNNIYWKRNPEQGGNLHQPKMPKLKSNNNAL